MARSGPKILHVPDFDFHVHNPTLGEALDEIRQWSAKHPDHIPIFILLELKQETVGRGIHPTRSLDAAAAR
jgi:hypothetical protein